MVKSFSPRPGVWAASATLILIVSLSLPPAISPSAAADTDAELKIALALADVIRASRTEIASLQNRINDPEVGDKGLSGDVILDNILNRLKTDKNFDPGAADPETLEGRLLLAQLESIREIGDENQTLINKKGIGFKGFVPAVFAQMINERFGSKVGAEAELKVTAPLHLVRNRKARPVATAKRVRINGNVRL